MKRNRKLYLFFIGLTILLGLLSRTKFIPQIIYPYIGDYFYAVMFFFLTGFVFPLKKPKLILTISLLFCYSIEFLQLYRANWIVNIRNSTMGSLILGHGFLWSDIVSYTLGGFTLYFIEKRFYTIN